MSKAEILAELPELQPAERPRILKRVVELAGVPGADSGELTEAERALIGPRLAECRPAPSAGQSWPEAQTRILSKLPKA